MIDSYIHLNLKSNEKRKDCRGGFRLVWLTGKKYSKIPLPCIRQHARCARALRCYRWTLKGETNGLYTCCPKRSISEYQIHLYIQFFLKLLLITQKVAQMIGTTLLVYESPTFNPITIGLWAFHQYGSPSMVSLSSSTNPHQPSVIFSQSIIPSPPRTFDL